LWALTLVSLMLHAQPYRSFPETARTLQDLHEFAQSLMRRSESRSPRPTRCRKWLSACYGTKGGLFRACSEITAALRSPGASRDCGRRRVQVGMSCGGGEARILDRDCDMHAAGCPGQDLAPEPMSLRRCAPTRQSFPTRFSTAMFCLTASLPLPVPQNLQCGDCHVLSRVQLFRTLRHATSPCHMESEPFRGRGWQTRTVYRSGLLDLNAGCR